MKIRFYLDAETNLPHIYNHNVTEEEVYELRGKPLMAYKRRKKRRKK